MKEALIKELNRIRSDKTLWKELAWEKGGSQEHYFDKNALKRTRVVLALQWDLQPNDEAFLQFLIIEIIKDRRADPFQGITETLSRAGYLLASFKNPANVWLLTQAKSANFDTHCGFDYQHLLSAGVKATFVYIVNQESPHKEYFHEFFPDLPTCSLSENDIAQWHQYKQADYLTAPPENDVKYWLEVALEINEISTARELIVKLEAQSDENLESLSYLKYYKERIEDYAGAVVLANKILAKTENVELYDYISLIKLHLSNNDPATAWQTIQQTMERFAPLGRFDQSDINSLALEVVLTSTGNEPFALEAYQQGMNNINNDQLHLIHLERHSKAAQLMGDKASESVVQKLYDAEAKRIEVEMQRFKEK
ncbi:MAG TPA: hypothetical protein DCS93_03520 [Microscillaceae bacterium]|nr:hypothetical protein [Microscillaceae bacterium]